MLDNTSKWSHARGNTVVPSRWQATLRDPEPLVTPQALDLLVVHHPPLGAGVVVRPPIPVAGMVLRPGAQLNIRFSERHEYCG